MTRPSEGVPPLRVQRMGKKFRIVYSETRNLAKFNSGEPVDNGGFDEEIPALQHLAKVTAGATRADPEEENIGP